MQYFDVAVVGAGPAGAWAAHELARMGARVAMFDHSHPREKPCGGGVTSRAFAVVASALCRARPAAAVIERARFEASAGHAASVPLASRGQSPESSLVIFSRATFDLALVHAAVQAGATWCTQRVRDVEVSPRGARVTTATGTYHSDFVIGADGANSLVRRRVARPFARHQLSLTAGVFAHGLSTPEIIVRFVADPQGYIWSFPRPDHLAIGIGAQADETRPDPLRRTLNAWMTETGLADGARLESYAWPIPSLSAADLAHVPVSGPRWVLVGDAGGLVDPVTREGIYFALRSGALAAEALGRSGGPPRYQRAIAAEIYPEIVRASRWKRGLFGGPFIHLLVHALERSTRVRHVMCDLVAGQQPYRGLKRRLLRTWEVGLAWQLLRIEHTPWRSTPSP